MRRLGVYQRRPKGIHKETLAEHEWWLPDLARLLEIPDVHSTHGSKGMDQGSATADLTLSINCLGRRRSGVGSASFLSVTACGNSG